MDILTKFWNWFKAFQKLFVDLVLFISLTSGFIPSVDISLAHLWARVLSLYWSCDCDRLARSNTFYGLLELIDFLFVFITCNSVFFKAFDLIDIMLNFFMMITNQNRILFNMIDYLFICLGCLLVKCFNLFDHFLLIHINLCCQASSCISQFLSKFVSQGLFHFGNFIKKSACITTTACSKFLNEVKFLFKIIKSAILFLLVSFICISIVLKICNLFVMFVNHALEIIIHLKCYLSWRNGPKKYDWKWKNEY